MRFLSLLLSLFALTSLLYLSLLATAWVTSRRPVSRPAPGESVAYFPDGTTIAGTGYHWYGRHSGLVNATAVWAPGGVVCSPAGAVLLSGLIVVSDLEGCSQLPMQLYAGLNAAGVAGLIVVSKITCPRQRES